MGRRVICQKTGQRATSPLSGRRVWTVVFVVAAVVLAASLAVLGALWFSYLQGQQKYEGIAESVDLAAVSEDVDDLAGVNVDWDALRAVNPDVVAWVYIPRTNVNYPVVRGKDNEYYLTHDFGGEAGWLAQYGSVFMDWRNNPDWSDAAYFLYGHHMNDGSMFTAIAEMADQARFDAGRTVYLLSPTRNFKLRTFSLVHCAADDPLVQTGFGSPEDMAAYIQDKIDRSIVNVGEIPGAVDITKSFAFATCDNVSGGRYVLYAYIENEIER